MNLETRILARLKSGRTITPLQALNWYGCLRLAVPVNRLRRKGHRIMTIMVKSNGKTYGKYSL